MVGCGVVKGRSETWHRLQALVAIVSHIFTRLQEVFLSLRVQQSVQPLLILPKSVLERK